MGLSAENEGLSEALSAEAEICSIVMKDCRNDNSAAAQDGGNTEPFAGQAEEVISTAVPALNEKVNQLFTLEQVLDAVELAMSKLDKGKGKENTALKNFVESVWQSDQSPSTQTVTTTTSTSSRLTATTPSKATPTTTASTSTPSTITQTVTEINGDEGLKEDPKGLKEDPKGLNEDPTSIEYILKTIEKALQEIENPKNTSDLSDEIASYHMGDLDRTGSTTVTSSPVATSLSAANEGTEETDTSGFTETAAITSESQSQGTPTPPQFAGQVTWYAETTNADD